MADKKDTKKVKAPAKRKKKSSLSAQMLFLMLLFLIAAALFLPTTVVLFFGMMPTIALFMTDKTQGKTKSLAVGLLNFAGTAYILMQIWTKEHTLEYAMQIMMRPESLIIMYFAAGAGYIIQSVLSGLIANVILHQTRARKEDILRTQEVLEKRWGYEVTGKIPLDAYGFPIEEHDPKTDKAPSGMAKKSEKETEKNEGSE